MNNKEIFEPDFILIPYHLMQDTTLKAMDRTIYGIIYWYSGLSKGRCTAKNETIAKIARTTSGQVKNSLLRLERGGHIQRFFEEPEKRTREFIIPVRTFKKGGDALTGDGGMHSQVTGDALTGAQIKNNINNNTLAPSGFLAPSEPSTPPAQEGDPLNDIYNHAAYVEKLFNSPNLHDAVIAAYWFSADIVFTNKAQARTRYVRDVRPARKLASSGYEWDQICKAIEFCKKEYGGKIQWTLETVEKVIAKVNSTK